MLCQVSSSYDNGQSMEIYHSCMKHAPSVAIVLWPRSEHGYRSLRYQSCSVSCHRLMTMDRAWLYIPKVWNLLCQLSMSHHNVQSMVIYPKGMNHAPSVVIVSWQQSEQGNISFMYETCSVSCHHHMTTVRVWLYPLKNESCSVSCNHLMTTARARLFISKVWNMLRQLSSSRDNGESMVIYHISLKTCPASCLRLMTTDKAWLYIPKIWIMPHKLSSSHDNGKSMITPPQVWVMLCQLPSSHDNGQSMVIFL